MWLVVDGEWSFVGTTWVTFTDKMDLVQVEEVCHSIIFSQRLLKFAEVGGGASQNLTPLSMGPQWGLFE